MQKLNLKLILLLTISLSGCQGVPTIAPKERCVVILESDVGQFCRCHMYEWTRSHIGRITESYDKEIMYCNKLVGFSPDSTGEIYTWQESIRLFLNRQSRNPKK